MKRTSKYALLTAAALTVAVSAQAYTTGDLLLGVSGGPNDLVFNLGPRSSLYQGETWSVTAPASSTEFGVIGVYTDHGRGSYFTAYSSVNNGGVDQGNIYYQTRGPVETLAQGIGVGSSRTVAKGDDTSWFSSTVSEASGTTFYNGSGGAHPDVTTGSDAWLWDNNQNGASAPNGFFTYDGGTLTYIPEPTTFSLLGGFGLLALAARRQLRKA